MNNQSQPAGEKGQDNNSGQQPVKTMDEILGKYKRLAVVDGYQRLSVYYNDALKAMEEYASQFREGQQSEYREALEKIKTLSANNYNGGSTSRKMPRIHYISTEALSSPVPSKEQTVEYWEKKWKEANEFIADIAKFLGQDELGHDDITWTIDDFKDAIKSYHPSKEQGEERRDWESEAKALAAIKRGLEKNLSQSFDFFKVLEENYQAQIAGYYNHDKTDEERKIRNAIILEYQDLIAIYKSKTSQPTSNEEQRRMELEKENEELKAKYEKCISVIKRIDAGIISFYDL